MGRGNGDGMDKIYRGYTREELDRQYEHRHIVPDADAFVAANRAESARVRAALRGRFDVAYGPEADQSLDIYLADAVAPAPIVVFFHGGRWALGGKESDCGHAEVYVRHGVHFVSVGFGLLPAVTMDVLVHQCRDAVAWVRNNAASFGGDPDRIFVHGKSSGAHVAAMMAVTNWPAARGLPADTVKGGLLVSGMYDLEPVRLTFRNDWLRLDAEAAARNSPIRHVPDGGCPLILAVGSLESAEFRRQPRAFAEAWRAKGLDCRLVILDGRHHFTVHADMRNPCGPLVGPFLDRMRGASAPSSEKRLSRPAT